MKKHLIIVGITLFLLIVELSGCTEEKASSDNNENKSIILENKVPVAVINIRNKHVLWWNDTLYLSAEDSYDPDGNIVGYVWWFDDGFGFVESKTGKTVSFKLPDRQITATSLLGRLTLAVTDNEGATAFAFNESVPITYRPWIGLQQINSTPLVKVTYIANLPYDIHLYEEELYANTWLNGNQIDYGKSFWGFNDVNGDGYVSEGDIINLTDIFYEDISGSTVKIELTGKGYHNPKTIVASIEVEIE